MIFTWQTLRKSGLGKVRYRRTSVRKTTVRNFRFCNNCMVILKA
jgi:hypothetical protein